MDYAMLRGVVDMNVRLSRATQQCLRLPTDKTLWRQFESDAISAIRSLPDGATVLDLGGGRRCVYAHAVVPRGRLKLIAVDVSPEELALNQDVDDTCVSDIAAEIPLPDESADLILSRALLEHVNDVPAAIANMARVLRPGGVALHMIPCRYSLFGMAARLLPFGPLLALTHSIMPWTKGHVEFPVRYDHCWPAALEREFTRAGFSRVTTWVTWAQPGYFEAVYPLFLLYAVYEHVVRIAGLRRAAAYTVLRAVR